MAHAKEDFKYVEWQVLKPGNLKELREGGLCMRLPGYDIMGSDEHKEILQNLEWLVENNNSKEAREIVLKAHKAHYKSEAPNCGPYMDTWHEYDKEISDFFGRFKVPLPNKINVHLTSYGPGGSYNPGNDESEMHNPGSIHMWVRPDAVPAPDIEQPRRFVLNLVHETIHLAIEWPVIRSTDPWLEQRKKEGLVDTLCCCEQLNVVCEDYPRQPSGINPTKDLISRVPFKQGKDASWDGKPCPDWVQS